MQLFYDFITFASSSRDNRECNDIEAVDDAECDDGLANSDKDAAELTCPPPL